jgi:hypothetical protein
MHTETPVVSQACGSWLGPVVRAGLNTAPFTGGLASLWSDWDTSRRFRRVEDAIADLGRLLSSNSTFDPSKLSDAEMHLLEDTLNRVSREHREEKRRRLVNLLASAWTETSRPFDERILFNRAADEFEEVHLRVLAKLYAACPNNLHMNDLLQQTFGIVDEYFKFGPFLGAVNALAAQYGFVRRKSVDSGLLVGVNPDGLALHAACIITPLGQRFYEAQAGPE